MSKQPRYNAGPGFPRESRSVGLAAVCPLAPVGFPIGLGYICHAKWLSSLQGAGRGRHWGKWGWKETLLGEMGA